MQRNQVVCDRCGADISTTPPPSRKTIPIAWDRHGLALAGVRFVADENGTQFPDLCADCQTEVGRLLERWWQGNPVALTLSSRSSDDPDAVEVG